MVKVITTATVTTTIAFIDIIVVKVLIRLFIFLAKLTYLPILYLPF